MNFSMPRGVGGTNEFVPALISAGTGRLPPPGIWRGMSVPIMRSCRSARAELGLAGLPAGRLALSLELLPAAHKSYARATGGGGRKDMQRGRAGERREWCDRMWPRARCTRGGVVRHTARALKEGVVAAGVRTSARPRSWPTADALPAGGAGAGAQSAASTRAASCRPRAPGHPQAYLPCPGAPVCQLPGGSS